MSLSFATRAHNTPRVFRAPAHRVSSSSSRAARMSARAAVGTPVPANYADQYPAKRDDRRAGVVMHPTSLPGPYGIGDAGPEARAFVDWLAKGKMSIWQVLPLVPPGRPIPGVREDYWSPYSGRDAHCGNTLIISLDDLVSDGLLAAAELPRPYGGHSNVDFNAVAATNEPLIEKAAKALLARSSGDAMRSEFEAFRSRADVKAWLDPAAMFNAIDKLPALVGKDWWDWPTEYRDRDAVALAAIANDHKDVIDLFCATQFLFHSQWMRLKQYANARGVSLVGDMPIYVGGHSADVWANQNLFLLSADKKPSAVAGVPPDAFSEDGQLWGNPLFDWVEHKNTGYAWWAQRLKRTLELHDEVRIDHFRAFAAYWQVEAGSATAKNGQWMVGPGIDMFNTLKPTLGDAKIVAEDLGVITADVVQLREEFGAPGMVVLQFAWGGDGRNPHLLHNHYENSFCYPGTHDNETSQGWYAAQDEETKHRLEAYAGIAYGDGAWGLIKAGMSSVSKACVFTMQDVLALGNDARMNTPGVADGNWAWRVGEPGVFDTLDAEAHKLASLATVYDRVTNPDSESMSIACKSLSKGRGGIFGLGLWFL
jgi:4-alpha-glucanotransferase